MPTYKTHDFLEKAFPLDLVEGVLWKLSAVITHPVEAKLGVQNRLGVISGKLSGI